MRDVSIALQVLLQSKAFLLIHTNAIHTNPGRKMKAANVFGEELQTAVKAISEILE